MSDTPETQEAVERWRQGKINIFDEMARLETERDKWKAKFIQVNKEYGFELRDPCGTIWDHANKLQQKYDEARAALQRLADCDWVITPHDRMDAVRKIARDALKDANLTTKSE